MIDDIKDFFDLFSYNFFILVWTAAVVFGSLITYLVRTYFYNDFNPVLFTVLNIAVLTLIPFLTKYLIDRVGNYNE